MSKNIVEEWSKVHLSHKQGYTKEDRYYDWWCLDCKSACPSRRLSA